MMVYKDVINANNPLSNGLNTPAVVIVFKKASAIIFANWSAKFIY